MKRGIITMVICALSFCTQPARAELVTIQITAEVDSVYDDYGYLEGKIKPGDIITGWYTYDTSTPDSFPSDPDIGRYEHYMAPCGISLSVGDFEFKNDPANINFRIVIVNDFPWREGGLHDAYWVISYNNLPLSNGTPVDYFYWVLTDLTASVLPNDVLLLTPPVLGDWELNDLWISGYSNSSFFSIGAHVTSAIPEPATVLLFGLGSLLLRKKT